MENVILKDILLLITVLTVFVFGFFVMKRLDNFLEENYKSYFREDEEKPTQIVHNESSLGEEILLDIKKIKENCGKVKIVISNDDDCCDE